MTQAIVFSLAGNEPIAACIASRLGAQVGSLERRAFPDGETYLRYPDELRGRAVILVCSLDRPDAKFLPLIFAADAARDLGAGSVTLVAPYLAYMRQDKRFLPGEAITSLSLLAGFPQPSTAWSRLIRTCIATVVWLISTPFRRQLRTPLQ